MTFEYPKFWHLGSYSYLFYRSVLRDYFQSCIKNATSVLDAGCGDNCGYLATISRDTVGIGIDIDHKNAAKSGKKARELKFSNLFFLAGDLENLPFRGKLFDVILCCDVLEHVKNHGKIIRNFAYLLKKGGILLVCTTNKFSPALLLDDILPKAISSALIGKFGWPSHYERSRRISPSSFVRILINSGFIIEKFQLFGYPPFGKPWVYHYSGTKPPFLSYFWIVFDRITKIGFLRRFKEEVLLIAKRE